jgi:hypothetical protein
MADIRVERAQRASQNTWLWMAVALVLIAGLMAWLVVQTRQLPVAVVETETEEDVAAAAVPAVTLAEFMNPRELVGREVRVENVPVASRLSDQIFWTELPNGVPYLIRLTPAAQAEAGTVASQTVLEMVVGQVHTMSDSVLTAWVVEGALQDEGQRVEASFATTYLEATRGRRAR